MIAILLLGLLIMIGAFAIIGWTADSRTAIRHSGHSIGPLLTTWHGARDAHSPAVRFQWPEVPTSTHPSELSTQPRGRFS